MATTPTDTPPDRKPRREEFRRLRDATRQMLGLEPLCPECEDEEDDSEPCKEN